MPLSENLLHNRNGESTRKHSNLKWIFTRQKAAKLKADVTYKESWQMCKYSWRFQNPSKQLIGYLSRKPTRVWNSTPPSAHRVKWLLLNSRKKCWRFIKWENPEYCSILCSARDWVCARNWIWDLKPASNTLYPLSQVLVTENIFYSVSTEQILRLHHFEPWNKILQV